MPKHRSATETSQPLTRRCWFQFRLRTLFVLTFVAAIAAALIAETLQKQEQTRRIQEIIDRRIAEHYGPALP